MFKPNPKPKKRKKTSKAEAAHFASRYGTDKEYLEWLSFQPSCIDGTFNQYVDGIGRNIACHVRRASNSGTSAKPVYSAVAMTDAQHKIQSTKGEAWVLSDYRQDCSNYTNLKAKKWFDIAASQSLERWIVSKTNPQQADQTNHEF